MINYEDIGVLNCQPVNSFWKKYPALCEVTVWKPNISSMSILAAAVVASPAFKPFIQRPRSDAVRLSRENCLAGCFP